MGQAKPQHRFGQLVGQRAGVDHRNRQALSQVTMRLVHGGRAQQDHLGAVFRNTGTGAVEQQWEDLDLLAAQQGLVVRGHINRADRGTVMLKSQFLEVLVIEMPPVWPHGDDRDQQRAVGFAEGR